MREVRRGFHHESHSSTLKYVSRTIKLTFSLSSGKSELEEKISKRYYFVTHLINKTEFSNIPTSSATQLFKTIIDCSIQCSTSLIFDSSVVHIV